MMYIKRIFHYRQNYMASLSLPFRGSIRSFTAIAAVCRRSISRRSRCDALACGRRSACSGSRCGCFTRNLCGRLFFPMERFESTVRVNPTRLLGSVDDERSDYHDKRADDKHGEPYGIAAGRNLAGRDEAQDECEQ